MYRAPFIVCFISSVIALTPFQTPIAVGYFGGTRGCTTCFKNCNIKLYVVRTYFLNLRVGFALLTWRTTENSLVQEATSIIGKSFEVCYPLFLGLYLYTLMSQMAMNDSRYFVALLYLLFVYKNDNQKSFAKYVCLCMS